MFSACINASRNLLLTPSDDDWSAASTFASTVQRSNDEDNNNSKKHKKQQQHERFPHSLRLDDERIVYSFCDLHSIPEEKPRCRYHQVVRGGNQLPAWLRRRRNYAMNSEEFYQVLHKALQEERLKERDQHREEEQDDDSDERSDSTMSKSEKATSSESEEENLNQPRNPLDTHT